MQSSRMPWYPLTSNPVVEELITSFKEELLKDDVQLDVSGVRLAADRLTEAIAPFIETVVQRDNLPSLCHLLNGWGDAPYKTGRLLDYYGDFAQPNSRHALSIPQCEPEGDYHAGQSLAYAIMAGVQPEAIITGTSVSVDSLLDEIQEISKDDAAELGHYFFALGWCNHAYKAESFRLGSRALTFDELIQEAVDSHVGGHFNVCRKFHLTEGICALAASTIHGSAELRAHANDFLSGQLETLFAIGAVHREIVLLRSGLGDVRALKALREHLLLGEYIENEYYYVGHAAELCGLAICCGYEISHSHKNILNQLLNDLSSSLVQFLPHVDISEAFLHLGHFRRGSTLMASLAGVESLQCSASELLREYTADFTQLPRVNTGIPTSELPSHYVVAQRTMIKSDLLDDVCRTFNNHVDDVWEARGTSTDFRRILRREWTRRVHYEVLIAVDGIGLELHVELRRDDPLHRSLRELLADFDFSCMSLPARFLPDWLGEGFRLRTVVPSWTSANAVTAHLEELIDVTKTSVARVINEHGKLKARLS